MNYLEDLPAELIVQISKRCRYHALNLRCVSRYVRSSLGDLNGWRVLSNFAIWRRFIQSGQRQILDDGVLRVEWREALQLMEYLHESYGGASISINHRDNIQLCSAWHLEKEVGILCIREEAYTEEEVVAMLKIAVCKAKNVGVNIHFNHRFYVYNHMHKTPFVLACEHGSPKIVKYLTKFVNPDERLYPGGNNAWSYTKGAIGETRDEIKELKRHIKNPWNGETLEQLEGDLQHCKSKLHRLKRVLSILDELPIKKFERRCDSPSAGGCIGPSDDELNSEEEEVSSEEEEQEEGEEEQE
jgi:hypothetical protein